MERNIILNRIRTPDGTVLTSHHVHDYVTHIDANGLGYMVDGGNAYLRRTVHKEAPYEELSIYSDAPFEHLREALHRGGRGVDGKQPLTWVPVSKMNDNWLISAIDYLIERNLLDNIHINTYIQELLYRVDNNINIPE
jgi:hypothetical protein